MGELKRIGTDSKTGLIKWIEDHYHDIDQFVLTFLMKDKSSFTTYDCYSYLEALGLTEIQRDCIHEDAHNDRFICKERG